MSDFECANIDLNSAESRGGFVKVDKEENFQDGVGKCFSIGGKRIAMFLYKGKFGAISHECVHMGGPLAQGHIEDGYVKCPFHGWAMDYISGRAPHRFKGEDVTPYNVKVEDGFVWVSIAPMSDEEISFREQTKPIGYLEEWARGYDEFEPSFYNLQQMIQNGKVEVTAMGSLKAQPGWDDILFKGAQLDPMPLTQDQEVSTKTIIGKSANRPIKISIPFYVSHMSYGALSREAKIALAKGSALVDTMMCSGEGGMLPHVRKEAKHYIYELGTAMFSHVDDVISQADGIEIKIGQAAKPGLGGHLPANKITPEIARIRGIEKGRDSISPGRHKDINNLDQLKEEVVRCRDLTNGAPVGIKFSAGHVEEDIAFALKAEPDFITIDCRGGGTGAAVTHVKDNVCLPPAYAIRRARKSLDKLESEIELCVTGGFREASDIAKALALGADAVALASMSLVAIGCQRYRTCHTGNCPVGIATQDPALRSRFDIGQSVSRFKRLFDLTTTQLQDFARISGKANVHDLSLCDVFTTSNEISKNTDVEHA